MAIKREKWNAMDFDVDDEPGDSLHLSLQFHRTVCSVNTARAISVYAYCVRVILQKLRYNV